MEIGKNATVLLDIGNVIVFFDYEISLRRLRVDSGGELNDEVFRELEKMRQPIESGAMSWRQFYEKCVKLFDYRGSYEKFFAAWSEVFAPNFPMWRMIERLVKAGAHLHLLSNTSAKHMEYLRAKFEVFKILPSGTYSYECGVCKPDVKIFETALYQVGRDAKHCIYLDDLRENIDAARTLGINAWTYKAEEHGQAAAFLDESLTALARA